MLIDFGHWGQVLALSLAYDCFVGPTVVIQGRTTSFLDGGMSSPSTSGLDMLIVVCYMHVFSCYNYFQQLKWNSPNYYLLFLLP